MIPQAGEKNKGGFYFFERLSGGRKVLDKWVKKRYNNNI